MQSQKGEKLILISRKILILAECEHTVTEHKNGFLAKWKTINKKLVILRLLDMRKEVIMGKACLPH